MLDNLYSPLPSQVIVDIAPVYNALHSLVFVAYARQSPGIGDWSVQTRDALSQEEWEKHRLIASWIGAEALSNVADTPQALASFPAFIQALADREPTALRDALLYWMVACPGSRLLYKPASPHVDDPLSLLESEQAFFSPHDLKNESEEEIEILRQVYNYMLDPPALQSLVASYLDHFWQKHLKTEWERMLPELEQAVASFQKVDTTGMSHFEVIETITRRNLRGIYRAEVLNDYAVLCFIPSFHCGPYILRFSDGQELRIIFSARHLLDLARGGADVDHAYVVDRMKALADETRLEIIHLLKKHRELGTQGIIDELNLSKSAASRHLRQLYANNIVDVRVDEDGTRKYYRLDPSFKREMQDMLARLLG
jgi:DNA-binding transcriptional ArsR family regulator